TLANAQKNYFIYIQTENKQPFYVKIKDKVLSSSSAGYLVISKLNEGNITFNIGFPKDQWVQQTFYLNIENNDAGYLLKNFGDKGWGLYNLQNMSLAMNGVKAITKPQTQSENDDAFANTLAAATNTDVKVTKVEKVEPVAKKIETENVAPKKEVVITNKIEKVQTNTSKDGTDIMYKIITNNKAETVNVFIPNESIFKPEVEKNEQPLKAVAPQKEKFLDIELQNPNANTTESKLEKPVAITNSDCKGIVASADDFFKTRKKMVEEDNEDAMLDVARKIFRAKCYSVEQIKNLSVLFLTDVGKYNFFDAAYAFTYDTQNFATLQSLLKDDYFINRFKALIRK
ncbi:MAG: hypothetical protein ABL929_05510, partial [Ferruginibacter sp.]